MGNGKERREKGTGNVYQKSNGSWVGRITIGKTADGKRNIKYFSGKTQAEVKRKIREYNQSGSKVDSSKISVGTYIDNWLELYKKPTLKGASYDRLENTANHQIKPYIGMIQLQKLTGDDIQKMLTSLQKDGVTDIKTGEKKGASYSTIKKAYDCIRAVMKHALICGDIEKDPTLLVKMPNKAQFEQKEIRIFTKDEARLIVEESQRKYSTGTPVYIYGDAYILDLNTGLREGELIALEKSDWDKEKRTLRVQRSAQMVKKRDADGEASGYEVIVTSTKTYSGNRTIPLNQNATDTLERLCALYPDSKYIVCNSKGEMVNPDKIRRTFYRMLKNIGIEQTGMHALRHTFASFLFAKKIDVKTISKLLGHASVSITLNTYIHLIDDVEAEAVTTLDDMI